jgi:diguanylate cyclase (GGDEF)-like protein/PAS domain S-box-containing protein
MNLHHLASPHVLAAHMLQGAFTLGMLALSLGIGFCWSQSRLVMALLRRDQEALRQWSRRLADVTFDGLLIHRNGTILSLNRALARMLGVRELELLGQPFAGLATPEQSAALRAELEAPSAGLVEFKLLHADKTERLVELYSQPIQHDGLPATITAIRDVTEARADRQRAERLLNYDLLTGLPNRKLFLETLRASLAANDSQGGTTALIVLDLDHFKAMNEQFGRTGGDYLLRQLAARLTSLIEPGDMVGRLSGDKFAILQPHKGAANRAMALASLLETVLAENFVIEGQLVRLSASLGLAIYPEHATDTESLLKAAHFALGLAAQAGGGVCHVFQHVEAQAAQTAQAAQAAQTQAQAPAEAAKPARAARRGRSSEEQRLKKDLRTAIPAGQISLDYQPIFFARDLSLAGFEALCRWRHPEFGLVPPNDFIPLAEQSGLIYELGGFVLETACTEAARAAKDWVMAVNLSPLQFRDPQLPMRIGNILKKTGLKPAQLELEVTESLLIDNADAAREALAAIRKIGVSVALDDFGTGFSSLSYLSDFPFTRLKIDKHFVQTLGRDSNAEAIISAILSLAHTLQLEVTAEGVETPGQLAYLQEHGCHLVQGFLLGRPAASVAVSQPLVQKLLNGPPKPALFVANG